MNPDTPSPTTSGTAPQRQATTGVPHAHRHSIPLVVDGGAAAHEEAASLIEAILKGGNSVRRA